MSSREPELIREIDELRARLEESEEMLRAIRTGEVDALIVEAPEGPRLFVLQSADAESNRFRSDILAKVNDAVIAVDDDQHIIYLNPAAELQYGIESSAILGLTLQEIYETRWLSPDDEAASNHALSTGGQWLGEQVHVKRNGDVIHVESSVSRLLAKDGTPSGLLSVIRDVTDRSLAENALRESEKALRAADRNKDEFLAMLAHELRNPLAPLLTGIDILLGSAGDASTLEKIGGMMQRQVGQMAHLIDDLLDVSRITHGKIELQKAEVSVADIVKQAVESVQPLIENSRHQLVVEISDPDLTVIADRHRMTQVVSNLLSNAAKYTPPRGRIALTVFRSGKDRISISVEDNGKGISPENQNHIFDLFNQGAAGPKDGLGIGLTLVKSLISMHEGRIEVESKGEGMGSKFLIEIPGVPERSEKHDGPSSHPSGSAPSIIAPSGKMRVLVADDGKATADILGMFFRLEGMDCEVVYDGGAAVQAAGQFYPDLACFDLGMPVLDGYEAASHLRTMCPEAYIVALSGWGTDEDRRKTKEAGFDEHLVKPVSPTELRMLLSRVRTARGSGVH